ncbi:MAG: prefoldin subunit [Candidatus Thalassarchaeum sp.]|nr:hypothetical protein [Euryarchaeota archaeon]|tara:strand:- start:442 stop:765 length:324 start_codon:yes stop_codon:yes gene_type:complete
MSDPEATAQELQALAQELQMVRSQVQAISSQISEISMTLESLDSQNPSRPVYRAVGNLLLEVDDRDALRAELEDSRTAFVEHSSILEERESNLVSQYEELVKSFESR